MPIRVTCSSCHARFNVSDQFAGKEGPCPKCKTMIKIPDKEEEVVIAVPDDIPPEDLLEDLEEAELEVNWMIKMSPVLPSSSPN